MKGRKECSDDHFYTVSAGQGREAQALGFRPKGSVGLCAPEKGLCGATRPLHRFYNDKIKGPAALLPFAVFSDQIGLFARPHVHDAEGGSGGAQVGQRVGLRGNRVLALAQDLKAERPTFRLVSLMAQFDRSAIGDMQFSTGSC